jgi:hypothetical protein
VTAGKHFSDLGLMSKEDIRKEILLGKFSVREAEHAVNHCVTAGVLEMYYIPICNVCNGKSHIMETDPPADKVLKEITQTGFACRHCMEWQQAEKPVPYAYALPQRYMGEVEEEYDLGPTIADRINSKLVAFYYWLHSLVTAMMFWRKDGE